MKNKTNIGKQITIEISHTKLIVIFISSFLFYLVALILWKQKIVDYNIVVFSQKAKNIFNRLCIWYIADNFITKCRGTMNCALAILLYNFSYGHDASCPYITFVYFLGYNHIVIIHNFIYENKIYLELFRLISHY
jgi:hypothetical protein